jgi:hypothetical protein
MYVLEYLIYHLKPFGVDTSSLEKFGPNEMPLMSKAYLMAIQNMGQDDAFKKQDSDLLSLVT